MTESPDKENATSELELRGVGKEGFTLFAASGPREQVLLEMRHYSAMYADEGPIKIYEVRLVEFDLDKAQ